MCTALGINLLYRYGTEKFNDNNTIYLVSISYIGMEPIDREVEFATDLVSISYIGMEQVDEVSH